MHQQIRLIPTASPPDIERVLVVLAEAGVNILAAGGGDLELGGEFAFAPREDQGEVAMKALTDAQYAPRLLEAEKGDYKLCWLENVPDQLRKCISDVAAQNVASGKVIKDVLVGVERNERNEVPVQVYSVEVKTAANRGGSQAGPRQSPL
jgi:hypothetical protein